MSAGSRVDVSAPPLTLARMALAVGVTAQQLRDAGRGDAADELDKHGFELRQEPVAVDDELAVLGSVVAAMSGVDEAAQGRILAYLVDRFGPVGPDAEHADQ